MNTVKTLEKITPVVLGALLGLETAKAGSSEVGTIPLDPESVQSTTANIADRTAVLLGQKQGAFIYSVPFQSESDVGGATVSGRNAGIVSCSPAAVWMLLQSTHRLDATATFATFITKAGADRDPTWGWTHEGFKKAAAKYGVNLEVNDYGDPNKFTSTDAWTALTDDLARGPAALSIKQVNPDTKASESKNTHMVVLRGAMSDGKGHINLMVNDPIAKSEKEARNPSGTQARDHRVGVTTWPESFVKESSLGRWLVVSQ